MSLRFRRALAELGFAFVIACAAAVRAQSVTGEGSAPAPSAQNVRLEVTPPDSPIVPLLRAEIVGLGLGVADPTSAERARISVRLVVTADRLEVWITDETAARLTLHEVFSQPDGAMIEPRTAVLHTVELLRWYLRGGLPSAAPTRSAPAPPIRTPAPVRPPDYDVRASVLGAALESPGGSTLGVSGELDVLGRYGAIGLRLFGSAPLMPNRISTSVGSADVSTRSAGLEAVWLLSSHASRLFGEIGVGSALVSSHFEATAGAGYVAHDDDLLTVAPIADARLGLRVTDAVRLIAGAAALVPLRSDRVRFAGAAVGRYGQVLVTAGLGIELAVH